MTRSTRLSAAGANPNRSQKNAPKNPFLKQVEDVLKRIGDPAWLGANATLASPYVLGPLLEGLSPLAAERGRVLQGVLLQAADALADRAGALPALSSDAAHDTSALDQIRERLRTGNDHQRILYWRYFQPQKFASTEHLIDAAELNMSRTHFFYRLEQATQQLAAALLRLLRPALRLEVPPAPPVLVGREGMLDRVTSALHDRACVGLCGPAGVGKTALAACVAASVAPGATFWFTLRPGVNITRSSLLYELAVFLAQHGAGNLWRRLIALGGAIPESAVAELRFDLEQLSTPVLLCVDELELLTPEDTTHTELVGLLQALRGYAPLLLAGQRMPLETDLLHPLDGLGKTETRLLLEHNSVVLAPKGLDALHQHTAGNPRLLSLFASLHQSGLAVEEFLEGAGTLAQLDALLDRIVRRLTGDEREALHMLAAYDRPVPDDLVEAAVQESLIERRLVQRDGLGGVSLVPALRHALARSWDTTERQRRHTHAAEVREARGETAAALHHYLSAGMYKEALLLWVEGQTAAVAQGQGGAALELLQQIPADHLSEDLRRELALARGQLELLAGRPAQAATTLDTANWPPDDPRSARAMRLAGNSAELRNRLDEAYAAYKAGLHTVTRLGWETSIFHKNLSWVAQRQRDLEGAWREACLARYEAINMQGYVREEHGDDQAAHELYLEALALAQEHGFRHGEAKTCNNLARLAARRQQPALAEQYADLAIKLFREIGDLAMVASVQVNLALAANQGGRPGAALAPAAAALAFFQQSGQHWGVLAAAQNLAEAHLALGELDAAETYATLVVAGDEPKTLPDGLRVQGEIALARGETARAIPPIRAAIEAARRSADRFLEAYAWRALGRALLARHKPAGATAALDRADRLFAELNLPQEQALTATFRPHML